MMSVNYRTFLILVAGFATPLHAGCPDGMQSFMSCEAETSRKALSVCFDADTARYAFGAPAAPDLVLSVPLREIAYQPWPGVGSDIWEEVSFFNNGFRYQVYAGVPRGDDAAQPYGGVYVYKGEDEIAHVACRPGSVAFPWTEKLGEAIEAKGAP